MITRKNTRNPNEENGAVGGSYAKEVDPKDTTRAAAYALWMKRPIQW